MHTGSLKRSAGSFGYARVGVTILFALAVGLAVFFFLMHQGAFHGKGRAMEPGLEPMETQQRMLQELAKRGNRALSDDHAADLKRELSADKGERVAIECALGDLESCYLAMELNLIFEASGWIVEEFLFAVQATAGQALILSVRDESGLSRAERLGRLFGSAGLPVTTRMDGSQPFDLKIVVPSRRPPATREGSG